MTTGKLIFEKRYPKVLARINAIAMRNAIS